MSVPVLTIDAFAQEPFQGNPAAVCFLEEPRDARWMQAIAREMNLSETAFLTPRAPTDDDSGAGGDPAGCDDAGCYDLRWFTPAAEVELCGHATLASAHGLWTTGRVNEKRPVRFHTRSGWLMAQPHERGIALDFPATRVTASDPPEGLEQALGARFSWVGKSRFDYLIELRDEATVRGLAPDQGALARLPVRGVIVTAASGELRYDFVSRFFAPYVGIAEDPVTGSAHCALTPFWAEKLGKAQMTGYQASARGGVVGVELRGERVQLIGRAITVMSGQIFV